MVSIWRIVGAHGTRCHENPTMAWRCAVVQRLQMAWRLWITLEPGRWFYACTVQHRNRLRTTVQNGKLETTPGGSDHRIIESSAQTITCKTRFQLTGDPALGSEKHVESTPALSICLPLLYCISATRGDHQTHGRRRERIFRDSETQDSTPGIGSISRH